ncbi:dihydrofolate reductase family protein [Nocardioides sp. CFH 31398]|uniref:dihydrofolate reductase family protein n=1 Tax=Nocardioides sp. CFH 31398 TaxID=2919579 RepID=UPI001F06C9B3|nr:dihydrofolate reductase family protein [Nocardioides sp. CFH 31398]MCH1867317.1 dihydrofolate reductase family protein [Nocardioides sp. CFH 31398]
MAQIVVTTFLSLDGVMDSPGGGEHPAAGWTFKDVELDEAAYAIKGRETEEATALLLGRVSYDEFAPVWPTMEEFAHYNAIPKYVVSSTLSDPEWNNTSVLRSLDEVAALKESHEGHIQVHGSARLAQGLAAAGLVDRYHLLTFPVVLGGGKRLFGDEHLHQRLTLVEHAAYGNGVTLGVYDVQR